MMEGKWFKCTSSEPLYFSCGPEEERGDWISYAESAGLDVDLIWWSNDLYLCRGEVRSHLPPLLTGRLVPVSTFEAWKEACDSYAG